MTFPLCGLWSLGYHMMRMQFRFYNVKLLLLFSGLERGFVRTIEGNKNIFQGTMDRLLRKKINLLEQSFDQSLLNQAFIYTVYIDMDLLC